MKEQYYFESENSEMCWTKEYFEDEMRVNNVGEMVVFKAIPDVVGGGIFWCKHDCFCGDDTKDTCGKQCVSYEPRNGKSGCCKHHTTKLYTKGEKIILTL